MTVIYKCMVCGYTAAEPGEHCGKAMVRQEVPETPAPAPQPAAAESQTETRAETPAEPAASTTESTPATQEIPPADDENKQPQ